MYKTVTQCRACGFGRSHSPSGTKASEVDERLVPVVNLGVQPLANDFWRDGNEQHGFAPLEVMFCPKCTNAQLSVVVRPDILYHHYAYVTSPSVTMQNHFTKLYQDLRQHTEKMDRILEIGSNDGRLLHWLNSHGHRVCGIDPAENLHPDTVPSICDNLCYGSAEQARFKLGDAADVVIARHVFCHVDDWVGFFKSLEAVTHNDSLIAIEVPYSGSLLARCEYDTIYHEHLDYLTFRGLMALLERTAYKLVDVLDYDIHGGVVLLLIRPKESGRKLTETAFARISNEQITEQHWRRFSVNARELIAELHELVTGLISNKKTVCAFGASAKSTVLINACNFERKHIAYICDSTKGKWYHNSPGRNIPVTDEGALLRELPDYAIMTCWNFAFEVMNNQKLYLEKGGKFIMPLPTVKIIP